MHRLISKTPSRYKNIRISICREGRYKIIYNSDIDEIIEFRKAFLKDKRLVEDVWDSVSIHVAIINDIDIVAAFRLTKNDLLGLPCMENFQENFFKNNNVDYEISRLVIRPSYRGSMVFYYVLKAMSKFFYNSSLSACTDSLEFIRGGIKIQSLRSLGFIDTGLRYYDDRYDLYSRLMFIDKDSMDSLAKRIKKWKR